MRRPSSVKANVVAEGVSSLGYMTGARWPDWEPWTKGHWLSVWRSALAVIHNRPVVSDTSETESNRQIIAAAFDAWSKGDAPITDVFAPGMVWRIEGHSYASREYASRQEFIDEVLAPFGARFDTSDPFRPVSIRGVFGDGDMVIVLWNGRGTTKESTTYENSYAWFMKMRDGLVVDGTAFYDSISFNDLWTSVKPS